MLKMKEVFDYCTDMDEVARDFTDHLSTLRNQQNEVVGIEKELFKWSMECELTIKISLPVSYAV